MTAISVNAGRVIADGLVFPEGPRWYGGALWLSDMHAHRVLRLDGTSPTVIVEELGDKSSGLGFLPDGSLLAVSMIDRALLRIDTASGTVTVHADLRNLSDEFINDLAVDSTGRAYVGSRNHGGGADGPKDSIILVEPDGRPRVVAEGLQGPNGIVIDGAERTLVVAETPLGRLTRFTITADGALTDRAVLAELPNEVFDGICLDA